MSKEKPTPLIILGMHRSGTSCLAGTLEQAGVCLGVVSHFNKYNKKGNKENTKIMSLNNKILEYNGGSWDNPLKKALWNKKHEEEGQAIIYALEQNCNTRYWGFKDPRVLLLLPFWNKLIPDAKYIGTYRSPMSVAKSLSTRKGSNIDIKKGLSLWLAYNKRLIEFSQETLFPLLSFDESAKEYTKKLNQVCMSYGLPYFEDTEFFDDTLRSQDNFVNDVRYNSEIKMAMSYLDGNKL